jgi:hypothetical protein
MTDHNTTPADDVERVAQAIENADVGFSVRLTRLVDDVSEYTANFGSETRIFDCYDDASEWVNALRSRAKARAAIAAMHPAQGPALPGDIAALLDGVTPGVWAAEECSCGSDNCTFLEVQPLELMTNAANARLIAAAPDLAREVARLREALGEFGDDYMTSYMHHPGYVLIPVEQFDRVCRARAAIAKGVV